MGPRALVLSWSGASDKIGLRGYRVFVDGKAVATLSASVTMFAVPGLRPSSSYALKVEAFDAAENFSTDGPAAIGTTAAETTPTSTGTLEPHASDIFEATAFLYTGASAPQIGVAPKTIERQRVSVLRGKVLGRDGLALAGVKVSVKDHPEFGSTSTGSAGTFDLAVNGGGTLTVEYALAGYVVAHREVATIWRQWAWLSDVALTPLDVKSTKIDLSLGGIQVARGSTVTDADGTRTATVLLPSGTLATAKPPDGTAKALPTITVRATELTTGADGLSAMPAALPANVAYTYDLELTIDEADALSASTVTFNQPVLLYVENFVGFPVGTGAPLGNYDRARAAWVPYQSGRVVKIVSITSGRADLDADGDGLSDDATKLAALGVTLEEQAKLATLYPVGASLWRIPIEHFTNWDANLGYWPPPDAVAPPSDPAGAGRRGFGASGSAGAGSGPGGGPTPGPGPKPKCRDSGSIIYCEARALGESLPIAGTSLRLAYMSDRSAGNRADRTMKIALSGDTVPTSLKRIDLIIEVAGQRLTKSFAALPKQTFTYEWDGLDAYGRPVQGATVASVRVGFVYAPSYSPAPKFGYGGGGIKISGSRASNEITLWSSSNVSLYQWNQARFGLGGWSIDQEHAYDFSSQTLHEGGGDQRSAAQTPYLVARPFAAAAASTLKSPEVFMLTPDGGYVGASSGPNQIWKVGPTGSTELLGGGATSGVPGDGDGAPAKAASSFWSVSSLALGKDGSIYFVAGQAIRKIAPDGMLSTIAGDPKLSGTSLIHTCDGSNDGKPAATATLCLPHSLVVNPDGVIYFSEPSAARIRRVGADGILTTVAGNGTPPSLPRAGEGGLATDAPVRPYRLALAREGSLYFQDVGYGTNAVRKLSPTGVVTTVVGGTTYSATGAYYSGDGGPASLATLGGLTDLTTTAGGDLLLAVGGQLRPCGSVDLDVGALRRVSTDGVIVAMTSGHCAPVGNVDLPVGALNSPRKVLVSPSGGLVIRDEAGLLLEMTPPMPGLAGQAIVPSTDGRQLFVFDSAGRHERTIDALTNVTLMAFGRDSAGRLVSITDQAGAVTTIERSPSGEPTAIVGPFGTRTKLTVGATGLLAQLQDPTTNTLSFTYSNELLTSLTDGRGNVHTFKYDADGKLNTDLAPDGGKKTLALIDAGTHWTVDVTTALGARRSHDVQYGIGGTDRVVTQADGSTNRATVGADGVTRLSRADGQIVSVVEKPDPRFGLMAPLASVEETTPGGLVRSQLETRTVTLSEPGNPLSLSDQTQTFKVNGGAETWSFTYKASSRTAQHGPGALVSTELFDDRGRVVKLTVPKLTPIEYVYDAFGRVRFRVQGPRKTEIRYGGDGFAAQVLDGLGRAMTMDRDLAGRVTQWSLPGGAVSRATYDAAGNVDSVSPPGRLAHTLAYDSMDRPVGYVAPSVGGEPATTATTFDIDGRIKSITFPDASSVTYSYGPGHRLQSVAHPFDTVSATWLAGGRVASVATAAQSTSFTYDGDLITSVAEAGIVTGAVGYTYDALFRRQSVSIAGASVSVSYDANGQLSQVGSLKLLHDPANGLLTGTEAGVVVETLPFDAFGGVAAQTVSAGSTTLFSVSYERDLVGRITKATETIGGATIVKEYSYDVSGRLASVKTDGTTTAQYVYDLNGNRAKKTGTVSTTATFDAQDRILTHGSTTFEHSPNGHLTKRTETVAGTMNSYVYDPLGNLRTLTPSVGAKIEYVINGLNQRVAKKVGGSLVQGFLYGGAGSAPVAELNGSGAVVSRFVYATRPHVPDLLFRAGKTYRLVTDLLGSVRPVVDVTSGAVVQRMEYDEFGVVETDYIASGWTAVPFGFAGGLYDRDTKLVRFGARDYDPEIGRWISKDPIGFAGGDTNLYGYVGNDPVNWTDPRGTISPFVLGLAFAAGIAIPTYYSWFFMPLEEARDSGLPGFGDGPQDAYRHCMDSCKVTVMAGDGVAGLADLREQDYTPSDMMDLYNNHKGRSYGTQICDASAGRTLLGNSGSPRFTGPSDDQGCSMKCMAGLNSGDLMVLNRDPDR